MDCKTRHCQMTVRPKELLDSCAPLQSISLVTVGGKIIADLAGLIA